MSRKKISCIALLSLFLMETLLAFIPIAFSSEQQLFKIIGVIVRSSSGSQKIYPGSKRVSLRVETMYTGNETAFSVTGHLITVGGIDFSAGNGPSAQARLLNGSFASSIEKGDHVTFDYLLDISKSLSPGSYILYLNITYCLLRDYVREINPPEKHEIRIEISAYPEIELRVIDAYLNPASCPGSVNTNLYVLLENFGNSSIVSANFNIALPEGFVINSPRTSVGAVSAGARFTVVFSDITVPLDAKANIYNATIYVNAAMRTDDNVNYDSMARIPVKFNVTEPPKEDPIMVSSISTLYQGSPAPLLPSASDVAIRVTLINRLPDAVSGMAVAANPPSDITIKSISGTYANGMAPGGSCFMDIFVDISREARLGAIDIPLNISYVRIVSGSSYMGKQSISIRVVIESPHSYLPELSLISAYWGSPNPTPAYEGARYVPLTLHFINNGRYNVIGGVIEANSSLLKPIKSSDALTARLAPGSSSTVTLYFDINTNASEVPLSILARYIFMEFGVHLNVTRAFNTYLSIERYPAISSNLMIVSSGWQNSYNVFPNTENATYQVTIANRAPFSISGIFIELFLPENFSSSSGKIAKAYVEGPIRSLSTFTASFTVTVGNVKSGKYEAKLLVDFILLSGGPGERRTEEFDLTIAVNDDSKAIDLISTSWYEGSVGPNTYGAHLLISLRNNYIDSMRGATLEINLPSGFLNAMNNSTYISVPPLSAAGLFGASQQIQVQDLGALISMYLRAPQASQMQAFSRGDILNFIINIHILNVSLGVYNLSGSLSYIDQWGTRRSVRLSIPAAILGRTEYVNIHMNGSLDIRGRFTTTSLMIENFGTSPLYDVYLIASPYQGMPILIVSPAVTYIKRINAGEVAEIPITLVYNPFGFITQLGGTAAITYGPVPLITSLIYRDAAGTIKRFNNTITVVVEPFIELVVRDIDATGEESFAAVNGIISNLGSAKACRVSAKLIVGNFSGSTLVGDISPAEEMAFRVSVPKYGEEGTLIIEYYNDFNEKFSKEITVNIKKRTEKPITPPTQEGAKVEQWIVIGAVITFLAIALFLIYRSLRARSLNKA